MRSMEDRLSIRRPSKVELSTIADSFGFKFDPLELDAYSQMVSEILEAYDTVDKMVENIPSPRFLRSGGYVPPADENKHGGWVRKLNLSGAPSGLLKNKRVAIKDTIAIAGVPLTAGTRFLAGTTPSTDASVVVRILEAGGTIVGTATCEYLTLSGGSHSSLPHPVQNPHRENYSAGGSSSGCAAVIAAGEADMAVGTDQGGSVRIPASWCGIVGLKPTYGLIPYTGIMPIEWTIDHAGPMSANVRDNALLLSVLAGPDGFDERQAGVKASTYGGTIGQTIKGLRIAVIEEAFATPVAESETNTAVREGAKALASLGAEVTNVSFPLHSDARSVWTPAFIEGLLDTVLMHNGAGSNHRTRYDTGVSSSFARWRMHSNEFSPSVKAVALTAKFMRDTEFGKFYGKSQNLIRAMRESYDQLFKDYDLLLMPTTPHRATPLPPLNSDPLTLWNASLGMNVNTAPFCATGHPAITVPCGKADGLPIGLMLIGEMWHEELLYQVAAALEQQYSDSRKYN